VTRRRTVERTRKNKAAQDERDDDRADSIGNGGKDPEGKAVKPAVCGTCR